jgi:hypothetical protein
MTTGPERHQPSSGFMKAHQDHIAGRGLSYLILLNGIAAIVIVAAFVFGFQISAEPKLAAAMVVFGTGAIAGLVSSFIAYLNRIVRAEMPSRPRLPNLLRMIGIIAVIVSGAAFLSGLSMVGTTSTARSSSQAKTRLQDKGQAQSHNTDNKDASRIAPGSEQGNTKP